MSKQIKWLERLCRVLRDAGAVATFLGILAVSGDSVPWFKENGAMIALAGMAAVGIFSLGLHVIEKRKNDARPVVTIQAKLMNKRERKVPHGNAKHINLRTEHFLTFRTNEGKQLTFQTDSVTWFSCEEGQKGPLTYQGWKLISFQGK